MFAPLTRLIGLIAVAAMMAAPALSTAAESPGPSHRPIDWRRLAPGISFARVEAARYVRLGDPHIAVVRLNPEQVRFRVFHMQDTEAGRPMRVGSWREKIGAMIAFNTGQYDERGTHLGLLVRDGVNIGTGRLRVWKGVFAAEPVNPALPKAVLIDLAENDFDPLAANYRQAVQSFMLLDAKAKTRVRKSDWKANRTILATDQAGRILVLCTEGGMTLWEMAEWLKESQLGVVRAMSLDGGYRAEMAVKAGDFEYQTYGQWETNDFGNISLPGFRATLPAVVGVFPR